MRKLLSLTALLSMLFLLSVSAQSNVAAEPKKDEPKKDEKKDGEDYEDIKKKDAATKEFESKKKPAGIDSELNTKIGLAIKKGVTNLLQIQKSDGSFGLYANGTYDVGGQALVLLTLVKCGVSRDSEFIERGKKCLRQLYEKEKGNTQGTLTYSAGVILMFLETYYHEKKEEPKEEEGRGTKAKKKVDNDAKIAWKPGDLDWIKELTAHLENTQDKTTGVWGYPHNTPYGAVGTPGTWRDAAQGEVWGDLSNTQYALLGLKAASRMTVKVKNPEMYRKAADFFMTRQDADGPKRPREEMEVVEQGKSRYAAPKPTQFTDRARGWAYPAAEVSKVVGNARLQRTGAMTTAAIAGLVICLSEVMDLQRLKDDDSYVKKVTQSIWDGYAWMALTFTVANNPSRGPNCSGGGTYPMWHYYYLYGMERAGMIAGCDFFGDHEWYPPGAKLLVEAQKSDGSWDSQGAKHNKAGAMNHEDPIADTCYALLFLKRATTPCVPRGVITGGGHSDKK